VATRYRSHEHGSSVRSLTVTSIRLDLAPARHGGDNLLQHVALEALRSVDLPGLLALGGSVRSGSRPPLVLLGVVVVALLDRGRVADCTHRDRFRDGGSEARREQDAHRHAAGDHAECDAEDVHEAVLGSEDPRSEFVSRCASRCGVADLRMVFDTSLASSRRRSPPGKGRVESSSGHPGWRVKRRVGSRTNASRARATVSAHRRPPHLRAPLPEQSNWAARGHHGRALAMAPAAR
jgi:hypothetical protein